MEKRFITFQTQKITLKQKSQLQRAKDGFVLIDDRPKNIKAWEDNGGIGILHESAEKTIAKLKELRKGD